MLTDNGVVFSRCNAAFRLSRHSVSWLRHGFYVEHIKSGHTEQNGRHGRVHVTLTGGQPDTDRPV